MTKKHYDVGYKKPPKATQFRKGQSGNPKGRPKGTKNVATDLREELRQKVIIRESGQPQKITKQRALLKAFLANAMKGNGSATSAVLKLLERVEWEDASLEKAPEISQADEAILQDFLKNYCLEDSLGDGRNTGNSR